MVHVPALAIAAPLMAFGMYRRIHRNIARQKLSPWRLWLRAGFLLLAFAALLRWPSFNLAVALSMLAGAVVGAGLSVIGLRHTRFETLADGQQFYKPNAILGVAISMLFVGRMIYRFIVLYPAMQAAGAGTPAFSPQSFAAVARSPLTSALIGLVIGYYVAYCLGVLRRGRQLRLQPSAAAAEVTAPNPDRPSSLS